MSRTTLEYVWAELIDENRIHRVRLTLTVREITVDEGAEPVVRGVLRADSDAIDGVKDGRYKIRYLFDGNEIEDSVRVDQGYIRAA